MSNFFDELKKKYGIGPEVAAFEASASAPVKPVQNSKAWPVLPSSPSILSKPNYRPTLDGFMPSSSMAISTPSILSRDKPTVQEKPKIQYFLPSDPGAPKRVAIEPTQLVENYKQRLDRLGAEAREALAESNKSTTRRFFEDPTVQSVGTLGILPTGKKLAGVAAGSDYENIEKLSGGAGIYEKQKPFVSEAAEIALDLPVISLGLSKSLSKSLAKSLPKEMADVVSKDLWEFVPKNLAKLAKKPVSDLLPNEVKTIQGAVEQSLIKQGVEAAEAKQLVTQGGWLGDITKNPQAGFAKIPTLQGTALDQSLRPIKQTDEATQQIYTAWSNRNVFAKELARKESAGLKNIPEKQAFDVIKKYQEGVATKYDAQIANTFDSLHAEAISRGLEVPFRERYIPQMYDNTVDEVREAMGRFLKDRGVDEKIIQEYLLGNEDLPAEISNRLKLNPNFTKERTFPDYETAMRYGLTPKYTHPAQLAAAYRYNMESALANKKLLEDLVQSGKLVTARNAKPGWKALEFNFSPKGYYAEPKLASALNGIFRDEANLSFGQKFIQSGAKASRFMQELALSAGFPGTDVNFFAIGQLIKEVTAGNFNAIPAFIRANSDKATLKFFEKKAPILEKMATHGLDLSGRVGTWKDMYKNAAKSPTWKKALGTLWDKAFQKKTFASFMPQLYTNTFEGTYKLALKKGMQETEATALAAKVTRAFHGIMEDVARSKTVEDTLSTVFFAPKFRESIIKTLWNTGKSLTTEFSNPAFRNNRKLATGMALTFAMYQALNYKLNGQYTWENEKGREFSLRVPLPNGEIMYVEFMPSFLSLPRNLAGAGIAAGKLDPKTFGQKASSVLSMPLQTAGELISNRDYFGRDIVGENDSLEEKLKKWGAYLGLQKTHPYLRLVKDFAFPEKDFQKPITQSISEAMEFPLKFNNMDRISRQEFYEAIDKKEKENAKSQDKIRPVYEQVQKLKAEGKSGEAQEIVNNLSSEDYEVYKTIKASDKRRVTVQTEARIFRVYEQVQKLKAEGKQEDAQNIVNELSNEEYKAYKLLKDRFK